jgi:CHAD domain-containing protein
MPDSELRVAPPVESGAPALPAAPWDKVRELAVRQLERFVSLEPKVLAGDDPGTVHDIRVASRRLQQVLDLLYPAPRSREIRRLRRTIRRSRRALGEVRNCDVLLERVQKLLARKRASRREAWQAVEHYLIERRAQSVEQAVRKLSRVNLAVFYAHLKGRLSADAASSPLGPPLALPPAEQGKSFHERIAQDLERFWQAFATQVAQSHHDPRSSVIHAVRIASKRLRYLIEVIQAFEVSGSAEAVAWLRAVQRHLGEWHDLEVLERALIDMVARPEFLRDQLELAMGVEKLILQCRAVKQGFAEKYFAMTRTAAELERLKGWVAYLLASPPAAFARG